MGKMITYREVEQLMCSGTDTMIVVIYSQIRMAHFYGLDHIFLDRDYPQFILDLFMAMGFWIDRYDSAATEKYGHFYKIKWGKKEDSK